jgi:hypothetical protein
MDPSLQAGLPKPAIAADPGPAAPAPRNGNGGPPAPTTVQPAQQAAHQVTQVSAAPTQAQRPANAATQASAKQAANGKEDEEDWWTE